MPRVSEITRHHMGSTRPGSLAASRAPYCSPYGNNDCSPAQPPHGYSSFLEAIAELFVKAKRGHERSLTCDEIARLVGGWSKNLYAELGALRRAGVIEPYTVAEVQHWGLADGGRKVWKANKKQIIEKGRKAR